MAKRLLAVLEVFSAEEPQLPFAQIARRTEIPSSTLYRMLADLTALGAVDREADGRYSIGLRLWGAIKLASRAERLVEVASPAMQDLHDLARGSVSLAVVEGGSVLYVHTVAGSGSPEPTARAGSHAPLTTTSVGQVLLAYAPSDLAASLLDDTAAADSAASDRLLQTLADVRRAGAAVSHRVGGDLVVAAPVCEPSGSATTAIELTAANGNESRLIPLVRGTGTRIARELGSGADR